jgi:hypothetical protein
MVQRSPHDHRRWDDLVAGFVAAHRGVPYCVLDDLLFEGRSCGNCVTRLSKADRTGTNAEPLLRPHRNALPHRQSYVQPTPACCRRFGVSEKRAEPLTLPSLNLAIGVTFFGYVAGRPLIRPRVQNGELQAILGKGTRQGDAQRQRPPSAHNA